MIDVKLTKQGNFAVSAKKIKEVIQKTLQENGIVSESIVDIAIVGKEKMDELNEKYYKDEVYEHPIFTFPEGTGEEFIFPPDGKLYLGQIVINYPMAVETAREQNKLIDDVVLSLAEHGSLHLVGIHH